MKLSTRLILLTFAQFVIIIMVSGWFAGTFLDNSLKKLESEAVSSAESLIANRYISELENFTLYIEDLAHWTATYNYINDPRAAYIQDNYSESTLEAYELTDFYILDLNLETVYGRTYVLDEGGYPILNAEFAGSKRIDDTVLPLIKRLSNSELTSSATLIHDDEITLWVVSKVISEGEDGTSNGYMLMAKPVGESLLSVWSKQTGIPIKASVTSSVLADELSDSSNGHTNGSPTSREDELEIHVAVDLLNGGQVIFSSHIEPRARNIFDALQKNSFFALCLLIISSIVLSYLLYKLLFINKLVRLTNSIDTVIRNRNYSFRFQVKGHDELSALSGSFNKLLETVEADKASIEYYSNVLEEAQSILIDENQSLEGLALTDELTKIANRRAFNNRLEQLWDWAIRSSEPISLILLDIDYFKRYNDLYGHQQGDECLAKIGRLLQSVCRPDKDLAARYGGEEFVLLLNGTELSGAEEVCKKIQLELQGLAIEHADQPLSKYLTVSQGVACIHPEQGQQSSDLVKCADNALYEAKRSGRNGYQLVNT